MFALQLVRCPFLNPRIRGVSILSEIIDITVRSGARCDFAPLFSEKLALALVLAWLISYLVWNSSLIRIGLCMCVCVFF